MKMNPALMKALSETDFKKVGRYQQKSAMICFSLSLILFVVLVTTNGTLQKMFRLLEKQGLKFSEEEKAALRQHFAWTVVQIATTVLGKSVVSTVFFADG